MHGNVGSASRQCENKNWEGGLVWVFGLIRSEDPLGEVKMPDQPVILRVEIPDMILFRWDVNASGEL
jgi:hypothetical protein